MPPGLFSLDLRNKPASGTDGCRGIHDGFVRRCKRIHVIGKAGNWEVSLDCQARHAPPGPEWANERRLDGYGRHGAGGCWGGGLKEQGALAQMLGMAELRSSGEGRGEVGGSRGASAGFVGRASESSRRAGVSAHVCMLLAGAGSWPHPQPRWLTVASRFDAWEGQERQLRAAPVSGQQPRLPGSDDLGRPRLRGTGQE